MNVGNDQMKIHIPNQHLYYFRVEYHTTARFSILTSIFYYIHLSVLYKMKLLRK